MVAKKEIRNTEPMLRYSQGNACWRNFIWTDLDHACNGCMNCIREMWDCLGAQTSHAYSPKEPTYMCVRNEVLI